MALAATFLFRFLYVFRHRFNSDEPQHLHVAWAATQGLTQYRDVFDNHAPLFGILSSPLAGAIGETPDILFYMRLAMIPCYVVALWCTYAIGRRLFDTRVGLWAAAILAPIPTFFFKSLEYRADDLWMALWMLALVVLLGGAWGWRRALAGGLLLGAALSTSLKTVLLLAALTIAALALPLILGERRRWLQPRRIIPGLIALCTGICVLPLALIGLFAARGTLAALVQCTVLHNYLPGLGIWSRPQRTLLFLPALLIVFAAARGLRRFPAPDGNRVRLAFVALTAGTYLAAVHTLWPLFTRQNLLPFYPLLAIVLTGLVAAGWERLARPARSRVPGWVASGALPLTLIAALEIGSLPLNEPLGRDATAPQTVMLAEVLRLTRPSDPVLDLKGETVFRRRPIYEVMESITNARLERDGAPERIVEETIAAGTCVTAANIGGFPERAARFLEKNYLPVGQLRVAGRFLNATPAVRAGRLEFEVAIPARYAIVGEHGPVSGTLDGEPYTGPRRMSAGRHTFTTATRGRLALIWAQAVERGFSPFSAKRPSS